MKVLTLSEIILMEHTSGMPVVNIKLTVGFCWKCWLLEHVICIEKTKRKNISSIILTSSNRAAYVRVSYISYPAPVASDQAVEN